MKVAWTKAAEADLEQIIDYIKLDDPVRAISFVHEIVAAGEAIADMPQAFSLVPQLEHYGIRRRSFGRYLILYRIDKNAIQVLHVVHSARDYIRVLFPEI